MAVKGVFEVQCPSCRERFDADFWTLVRGDQDLELKEALISGEFDLLMCPNCSGMFSCEETFVYLDPKKELFAFVMPASYEAEKDKWLQKMRADYETAKGSLIKEEQFQSEPEYYFGAQALTDILVRDRDIEEETDVMEFMAGERKFKKAGIHPAFARANDVTFSLPYAGGQAVRDSALKALREIVQANDALPRVQKLLKIVEGLQGQELSFIKK